MAWFNAENVFYWKAVNNSQDKYYAFIRIFLIEALNEYAALNEAQRLGQESANGKLYMPDGQECKYTFAGTRSLSLCRDFNQIEFMQHVDYRPSNGSIVGGVELLVNSEEELNKVVNYEQVTVTLIEPDPDPSDFIE